ncbi:MAG: DMT family transporter [Thermoplasmata archaeon]|nr:DMT family transporter [Thermoplasmata archaeon]
MRPRELALLLLLGAIWGLSYVFIRVAAPVMGPVILMGTRFAVGGLAILAYVTVLGRARPALADLRRHLGAFLVGGLFFAALPTTLIGFAELRITASLATVLNASTPFFAALGAAVWLGEAFPARRIAGLLLGFVGVALAVGTNGLALGLTDGLSVAASITAAACYGLYGVYLRRSGLPVNGVAFSLGVQMMAAVLLVGPSAVAYRPFAWSTPVLVSALALGLASTAFAYLLYHYLIEHAGPTQTSTVTFVSPVFGILGGALLLGEPIGAGLVGGLALIVIGILLAQQTPSFLGTLGRRPS